MENIITVLSSSEEEDLIVQTIYHISDIHIRLYHRLDEYDHVFQQLYVFLEKEKLCVSSALIVVTGDILHHKNELSPECIVVTQRFLNRLSTIFPTIMIAGNHDALLNNRDRMDSLSAILHANPISRLYYLRDSGFFRYGNVVFGVSSLLDGKVLAMPENKSDKSPWTWIALFHGGVGRFSTAKGHIMEGMPLSRFDGYDLVMLGDIHLFQYLDGEKKRVAYAGSLISQNFTETDPDHGVLIWDITKKLSHFHRIENPYAHCDAMLEDQYLHFRGERFDMDNIDQHQRLQSLLPEKGRMMITLTRPKTAADIERLRDVKESMPRMQITEKNVVRRLELNNGSPHVFNVNVEDNNNTIDGEAAFRAYFQTLPEEWREEADTIYPMLQSIHERRGGAASSWDLMRLEFDHMFGYGHGNILDFNSMQETIGIFGENSAGKSSLIEIIVFMLYGQITRYSHGASVPREVIHFREKKSRGMIRFRVGGIVYEIEKNMTLLKSQKIRVDEKLWKITENGVREDLSEEHRKKTDKFVISRIGSCQQFLFTTIFLQQNEESFRSMSPRDRKDFLYKILDLDRLEALHLEKVDEHRLLKKEGERIEKELERMTTTSALQITIDDNEKEIAAKKEEILHLESRISSIEKQAREDQAKKRHVSNDSISSLQRLAQDHIRLQQDVQRKTRELDDIQHTFREAELQRLAREQEWSVKHSFFLRTFGEEEEEETIHKSEWEHLERLYKQRISTPSLPPSLTSDLASLCREGGSDLPSLEDTSRLDTEKYQRWMSTHHEELEQPEEDLSILFREKEEQISEIDHSHDRSPFATWSLKKLKGFKEKQDGSVVERKKVEEWEAEREHYIKSQLHLSGWQERLPKLEQEIAAIEGASDQASSIVASLHFSDNCDSCAENRGSLADMLKVQESRCAQRYRLEEERGILFETRSQWETLEEKKKLAEMAISVIQNLEIVDVLMKNHSIKQRVMELETRINKIEQEKKRKSRIIRIRDLWKQLQELEEQRCHVVFMNQHVEKEIVEKKELLKKLEDVRKSRQLLEEAHHRIVTEDRKKKDLEREIKELQDKIRILEEERDVVAYNEKVMESVRVLDQEKEELRSRVKRVTGEEATLSQKQWTLNQELKKRKEKKTEHDLVREQVRQLQILLHTTGRDGYPMFLLQRYLPQIEEHLNEMVAPFLGGKQVAVRSEQKKESINILLYVLNGDSETTYVGGMEGFMIDAALKIVFTRISMQPRCGMFMIDEGISALDKKNMENLDQFFQFLEQFFPRVFIISHLREAHEFVQSSIHVRKDPLTQKSHLYC